MVYSAGRAVKRTWGSGTNDGRDGRRERHERWTRTKVRSRSGSGAKLDARSAIDVAVARGFAAAAGDKLAALLRLGVYEEDVRPRVAFGVQTLEEALSYLERASDHVKGALDRAQAQRLQKAKVDALGFQPPAADVPRSRGYEDGTH